MSDEAREKCRLRQAAYRAKYPDRIKAYKKKDHRKRADHINAKSKAWRLANPDRVKAGNDAYRAKHQYELNAYRKEWARKHPDFQREYDKQRPNRKERTAQQKAYYKARPDVLKAQSAAYHLKNAERVRAYVKAWRAKNPEQFLATLHRRRARGLQAFGSWTAAEWLAIVGLQGGKCAYCGKERKLTRDHIVPLARGGSNYAWNLQGLCRLCNSSKNANFIGPIDQVDRGWRPIE